MYFSSAWDPDHPDYQRFPLCRHLRTYTVELEPGDVLFIDEIHRLSPFVEEILYPAMEDFELDLVIGEGPAARSVRLTLPRFTLVAATTRTGLLTAPLRDRFGIVHRLEFYPAADLTTIVHRSAQILDLRGIPKEIVQIMLGIVILSVVVAYAVVGRVIQRTEVAAASAATGGASATTAVAAGDTIFEKGGES